VVPYRLAIPKDYSHVSEYPKLGNLSTPIWVGNPPNLFLDSCSRSPCLIVGCKHLPAVQLVLLQTYLCFKKGEAPTADSSQFFVVGQQVMNLYSATYNEKKTKHHRHSGSPWHRHAFGEKN